MSNENMVLIPQKSRIRTQTVTMESHTHFIEVYEPLESPVDWSEELNTINAATEDDTIILDLCTPGGCGDTAFLFNRALRSTKAHTVAIIGPQCSSAGSVLALSCKEWVLDETSELMCHTSQFGIMGKEVDIFEHVTFSRKKLEKLFKIIYSGFCTEAEINQMIGGTPMYFDGDDLDRRLTALTEYRGDNRGCGDPECQGCLIDNDEEMPTLEDLIKNAVKEALDARFPVEKGVKKKPAKKLVKTEDTVK